MRKLILSLAALLAAASLVGAQQPVEQWSSSKNRPRSKEKIAFLLLSAVHLSSMTADYEFTQACLHAQTCSELNPLFGPRPSRPRMYGIGGAVSAMGIYGSHRLRRHRKWYWWVPTVAATVTHGYLAYRNKQF